MDNWENISSNLPQPQNSWWFSLPAWVLHSARKQPSLLPTGRLPCHAQWWFIQNPFKLKALNFTLMAFYRHNSTVLTPTVSLPQTQHFLLDISDNLNNILSNLEYCSSQKKTKTLSGCLHLSWWGFVVVVWFLTPLQRLLSNKNAGGCLPSQNGTRIRICL